MSARFRRPSTPVVVAAIGKVTLLEILRDKVLYNTLVVSILLLGLSFLASQLSIIAPHRVVLDFGMAALSIACGMVAVFLGASMIQKEFDRRTVYVALSHPISRFQFLLGKYFGLALILLLNWGLLVAGFLLIYLFSARGAYEDVGALVNPTLITALVLVLVQSLLLAGLSILFSTFSTTSISCMLAIGLFLVGNSVSQLKMAAIQIKSPLGRSAVEWLANLLPNFENFSLGTNVTYGIPLAPKVLWLGVAYGLGLTGVCLIAAGLLVRSKEV